MTRYIDAEKAIRCATRYGLGRLALGKHCRYRLENRAEGGKEREEEKRRM